MVKFNKTNANSKKIFFVIEINLHKPIFNLDQSTIGTIQ